MKRMPPWAGLAAMALLTAASDAHAKDVSGIFILWPAVWIGSRVGGREGADAFGLGVGLAIVFLVIWCAYRVWGARREARGVTPRE